MYLFGHFPHQRAFKPGKANMSSLISPVRVKCKGRRSPGFKVDLGGAPCSRKAMGSDDAFLIMNLGANVITLVNLYFPRPSVHDTPTWISSPFWAWDGMTSAVSADGASKLTGFYDM